MKMYKDMNHEELVSLHDDLCKQYEQVKAKGLKLNMARGKPDVNQLLLSTDILDVINSHYDFGSQYEYCNYGILDGIDEAKEFFAKMLNTSSQNVIVYGNSSLTIMFDQISRGYTHGYLGEKPWCQLDKIKFLCPVPGYDRHFAITEHFGIEMINIPMHENGPDMDLIEKYVQTDESIKGIWCVPQYSNPTGITYSDEVVERFANLNPAAKDFRIYWDNAYAIHHLYEDRQDEILDIISECEKAGNPNLVYEFASTSKVTFSGSGVAAMASSKENVKSILEQMAIQTIGYDKMNQLRHVRYFKNFDGVKKHMMKHAEKMRPKFKAVLDMLESELKPCGVGEWTNPNGGYFISFNTMEGCAKKVVSMCKDAGMVLTGAGSPFPYGKDPEDKNIRIAPSFATPDELKEASEILIICTKITALEKILGL